MRITSSMIAYDRVKRVLDFTGAGLALVLLSPVMILLAALVKLDGGPVFFRHTRVGYRGDHFGCLKFRTMRVNSQEILQDLLTQCPDSAQEWATHRKLKNDPRVTTVGRFLRATSLDELPQLINVLMGHMAIVGPRPVTPQELAEYYLMFEQCYQSVRPGITGIWQVSGRSDVSYTNRVMMDVHYAQNHNLLQDLHILWRTPGAVISRRGAY